MKTVFLIILLLAYFCLSAEFHSDTMFVVGNFDTLSQNENIVREISGENVRTRGILNTIAFESGIQKDRSGAVGNFEDFSIRGISSARIGVFVDGNSVANASGGAVDLSRFNGLNVSKIDVYKGFVPAKLGGNVLGGAVNIITENPENAEFSPSVFLLAGSYGEFRANTNLNHIPLGNRTRLSLSGDWHSAKNDFEYMDYNGTFYGANHRDDDTIRRMDNNEYRSFSATAGVKTFQKNFDLDGNFAFLWSRYEIPSPVGERFRFRNQTTHDENSDYMITLNQRFHNRFESKINLSTVFSQDAFRWTDKDNIVFPYSLSEGGEVTSKNSAFDGGYFQKIEMGQYFALSLYNSARFEKINYQNDIVGRDVSDREVQRLNGAISADLAIFTAISEFILGGTIRGYVDRISNWTDGFVYRNIPDDTIFDVDKSLRLSVNNHFLISPLQVFADVVFAEKIPNLRQRYGYYGIIPNTNLLSEKVVSTQTGIIADFNKFRTSAAIFYNYSRDLIRVIYRGNVGQAVNIAEAENFGFENNIFWQVFEKIELRNNLTLQEPRNLSESSNKKLYLPNESRLKINSEVKIGDFAGVSFLPSVSFQSAYFHDLYNRFRVPFDENRKGLAFFNFVLQYDIQNWRIQAGVYDICSAGNSPEKRTALENPYFVLRYPGMNLKGSVLFYY